MIEKKDLYVYKSGIFTFAGVEGDALELKQGLENYLQKGKLKDLVDFSPILLLNKRNIFSKFIIGNIYSPDVCTMNTYQFPSFLNSNTMIIGGGMGCNPEDFILDFAEKMELEPKHPYSAYFKSDIFLECSIIRQAMNPFRASTLKKQKETFARILKEVQNARKTL